MAEHRSLQYWLESINLVQYYPDFIQHSVCTLEQCENLDNDTLDRIGVNLEGHKRRILTHLPKAESWLDRHVTLPNLPPKKKSVRDSYLYEDFQVSSSVESGLTIDVNNSKSSVASGDRSQTSDMQKVSPRPVPRPRQRSTLVSPATTPTGEKPVPIKRPTPAPRGKSSPKIDLSPAGSQSELHETQPIGDPLGNKCDKVVESELRKDLPELPANKKDENVRFSPVPVSVDTSKPASDSHSAVSESVNLSGVCLDASSTDDSDFSELYSFPDKQKAVQNTHTQDKGSASQNVSPNFVRTSNDESENACASPEADEIYVNLEDTKNDTANRNSTKPARANKHERGANLKAGYFEQEEFVNAEFDPLSKTFIPKAEESVSSDMGAVGENKHPGTPEEEYEVIWDCKGDNSKNTAASNRTSNLMHFSSLVNGPSAKSKQKETAVLRKRLSTFGKDRDSASFDLPPPQFAPPPLPTNTSTMMDVIADFDPLTQKDSSPFPNLPPRPKNYSSPNCQPYANVPGYDGSINPDIPLYSAQAETSNIGAEDPFKHEDPFGSFKPDCEDLDQQTGTFPPASCLSSGAQDSFVCVDQTNVFGATANEDIYEFSSPTPSDFDPFGLNRQHSAMSSVSGGSTDSRVRLSEVPPAPKNFHFMQAQDSTYSFAETIRIGALGSMSNHKEAPVYFYDSDEDSGTGSVLPDDADSSSNGSLDDLIDGVRDHSGEETAGTMTQVEIIPATTLSPRRRERSGYLYKQGGVNQNRGWRKRWVIFHGKSLRYYCSAKDQVSKRIVPLSCMKNVEIDVKERPLSRILNSSDFFEKFGRRNSKRVSDHLSSTNSKQFKFKVHCTNRVFLFAADSLDDCQMWSNTLMEAIITYTPPPGGRVPGEDMADPDMDGWIKINKNRYKFYVVLKKHKLCYYQNADDFEMASPLHEIDMKLSSVKEVDRTKLQLNTHYSTFLLHFESSSDASNWKMCIEEAITDAIGDNAILDQVIENPANAKCADCGASDAHWASMNLGVVLCLRCAGIHRSFDLRLSKIRSLRMDTRVWNSSLIEMFKVIGNDNANNFWLKNLQPGTSINKDTPSEVRKQHIQHKYRDKKYCDIHQYAANLELLNEALLQAAQTDDVLLTYQILLTGADVMYYKPGKPDTTAFELAKEAHQRIQMEFLLQNGGDKTKNFMPGSEEASLVAKLRAEVQENGYLHKTGSNMKAKNGDFLKRWCVLEHGHISYYVSEESKVEKDRIDNESILFIQAIHTDKFPASFEISTKKNNRVYLFAGATEEERTRWMQSIARVFCPVVLMDKVKQIQFSLAGYTYMKTGFTSEWQRTWILLENRKLIFIDKEETEREQDSVDLRKVSSIGTVTQSQSACEACLEPQGSRFVMKAHEKMLYFQADLARDTDRLFHALEKASKRGGDILEDQPLTNDDIPVIIATCIDFIQQHGLRTTGLYRKAEQETKIKGLLQKFQEDARSVVLRIGEESVDLVCNVFKRFLRNLSDPLLTKQLYNRWLLTADESDHNVKLQWYKYLLQQLPRINYLTLKALSAHLSNLSKHADENLMTLSNISIAFGPTLMNTDNVAGLTTNNVGNAMQLEMKVIEEIVLYHVWLFDVREDRKSSIVEDKIRQAQEKIKEIGSQSAVKNDDLIIYVYILNPTGSAESIKVSKDTTVAEVVYQITTKHKMSAPMTLFEIIKEELERPLCPNMKVMPLVSQWQNWSTEYAAGACLCLKSNDLQQKIENAYDPSKPLFCEMKFSDAKRKFSKVVLEFAQAKLSCYKDTKNVSNPAYSWNIEDLSIYKGHDSKRSPPTKFTMTVSAKGDKIGEKANPCFGRTLCCTSEQDLYMWLAGLIMAQNSGDFS